MAKRKPNIHIPHNTQVWDHELQTAYALVSHGYSVEFLVRTNHPGVKTADIRLGGEEWEIKSPKTASVEGIERNLKRATKQSPNIIIDSYRVKNLRDSSIQRFLENKVHSQKAIKRILFINRRRDVIDIRRQRS